MMNQARKFESKKRLLVVDDQVAVRDAIGRLLQLEGFEVVCVSNCHQAKQQLLEWPVDLLLLDLNLDGENGWESYKRLIDLGRNLPVIIMTARPDLAEPALAAGATLLEKPLDVRGLLDAVTRLLAKAETCSAAKTQRPDALTETNMSPIAATVEHRDHQVCGPPQPDFSGIAVA